MLFVKYGSIILFSEVPDITATTAENVRKILPLPMTNIDVKNIKNELDEMVARPKDTNKSDAFISMDANASTNTDTNVTKGEEK